MFFQIRALFVETKTQTNRNTHKKRLPLFKVAEANLWFFSRVFSTGTSTEQDAMTAAQRRVDVGEAEADQVQWATTEGWKKSTWPTFQVIIRNGENYNQEHFKSLLLLES